MVDALPPKLAILLADCTWEKDDLGWSEATVFRLVTPEGTVWYLKTAVGYHTAELEREAEVMGWLDGKLSVPRRLFFERTGEKVFLLMTAVPGMDFTHFNDGPDEVKETAVHLLATGLRQIHSLPITGCPFDQRLAMKMETAHQHMLAGQVDEEDFDSTYSITEAYQLLLAGRPVSEDLVFTHGDYCLPNIVVADGRVSGFIDLGRAGVADRYQDLAICWRSTNHNFGPGWGDKFLAAYGAAQPDAAKMDFYRPLDEFF
ncbi:MAG TPA: aminoglycoside 3'-phosphotransferase [Chloroflexota bacterium]|nr:aminoglycoside 3'-phosphotransferase [Chloroflexota bacterium]